MQDKGLSIIVLQVTTLLQNITISNEKYKLYLYMDHLETTVYSNVSAYFEGSSQNLNINEKKWDSLFELLNKHVESIFFLGYKINKSDDEFDNLVLELLEAIILADYDPPQILLFKIKKSLQFDRAKIAQLMDYYTFPMLIYSYYPISNETLIWFIEKKYYPSMIVAEVKGLTIIHTEHWEDGLKIESSSDMPDLHLFENL